MNQEPVNAPELKLDQVAPVRGAAPTRPIARAEATRVAGVPVAAGPAAGPEGLAGSAVEAAFDHR